MTGKITVTNPNDWQDVTVDVTDAINNGGSCVVTGGTSLIVPKSGSKEVSYTCTYAAAPSAAAFINTGTATWDKAAAYTPNGSANGTASGTFSSGNQTRGYLSLKDSIQCLTLAIQNPPSQGEYRVFNQFENIYSINQLADLVISASEQFNLYPHKMHLPNPRTEADKHYYNPAHQRLFDLGYIPTTDIKSEIIKLINDLIPYKDRIIKEHIMPTTTWR